MYNYTVKIGNCSLKNELDVYVSEKVYVNISPPHDTGLGYQQTIFLRDVSSQRNY